MPEPFRTLLDVLLTALFGLNVVLIRGFSRKVEELDRKLGKHETAQADSMLNIDKEMAGIRSNYVDRFAEINNNIFNLERKMLTGFDEIHTGIVRLEAKNKKE